VADRGEPVASARNGTELARPVWTIGRRTWQQWHQLGRWVRPVQEGTSLVGKPRSGAAERRCTLLDTRLRGW
jgi:hypothetical protein